MIFLILLFGVTITFQNINAQDWAPVGAKWYFAQIYMMSNEVGYNKIEVEKDTMVQGKNCKKLIGDFDGCSWKSKIMYESNDSVYFYHTQNNEFSMLYDFGVAPGDVWKIPNITSSFGLGDPDTTTLIVDSIGQTTVSGENLRVIYTTQINTSSSEFSFGGQIIERIGAQTMFPNFSNCDPVLGQIRCYSDSVINYHKDTTLACDYSTVGITPVEKEELSIYPNPAKNYLQIKEPNIMGYSYSIYDLQGRLIQQGRLESKEVNISKLEKGSYHLSISLENKIVKSSKFIKL